MTIDDMRYVLKIAESGSVSKAAKALFVSQPTLSQRLQKVETELGVRLFERNRFGDAKLTDAGQIFCRESTNILGHWQRMQDSLQAVLGNVSLTMGIPVRTGSLMVAGLLEELQEKFPGISLHFRDRSNADMEELIAKGELDLGLVRMAAPNSSYKMRPLYQGHTVIRLRKGSPLRDKITYHPDDPTPYIDLKLLENEPIVCAPSSREHRSRSWIEAVYAQIPGMHPNVAYTVPNMNLYDYYLKSGTASCIMDSVTSPADGCRLEPEYDMPYTLYFVQNKKVDPAAADAIFQILQKNLNHPE